MRIWKRLYFQSLYNSGNKKIFGSYRLMVTNYIEIKPCKNLKYKNVFRAISQVLWLG